MRLKLYTKRPISRAGVVGSQLKALVGVRMQLQVLTILYLLSEHWGMICVFYSLTLENSCSESLYSQAAL